MARKPKQTKLDGATPAPVRAMTVYLPAQLHARLKIAAAHEGKPMNKIIIPMISKGLKEIGG